MSRIFLIAALFVLPALPATTNAQANAQSTNAQSATHDTIYTAGRQVIAQMYDRYSGHWYQNFTFNQTTEQYHNDSLVKTQTWYEFIRFPDRFRMDFGDADSGNAAIFRGDSCYRFKNGKLVSTTISDNEGLIFLLGGMFFYPLDHVFAQLGAWHYDLNTSYLDVWQNRPVIVIGTTGGNQLWIDRENLYLVRLIKNNGVQRLDARFDNYQLLGGGWAETKCTFFLNGKLVQKETYHDSRSDATLDDNLFDPAHLIRSH